MPQDFNPNEKRNEDNPGRFDSLDLDRLLQEMDGTEEYESGATQKFTSTGHVGNFEEDEDDAPGEEIPADGESSDTDSRRRKRRRPRRTGCAGAVLYAVFVIALSCVLAAAIWVVANDVLALHKPDNQAVVVIEKGDTNADIAGKLKEAGIINQEAAFKLYAKFADADKKVEPGEYTLNSQYDYYAIVSSLSSHEGLGEVVRISFPEGFTLDEVFQRLEENDVCTVEELREAAASYEFDYYFLENIPYGDYRRLEGYLFPDTYDFYENENPESAISRFLRNFNSKINEDLQAAVEASGKTMEEIIIIASMIEKEAGSADERTAISSVIYNRLDIDMRLQIDATVVYALGENYTGTITYEDLEFDSPYNTYVYYGLPKGAIANPGLASIRAAINPKDTNYYYYALGTDGNHRFFNDADSFNNFVASDEYGG